MGATWVDWRKSKSSCAEWLSSSTCYLQQMWPQLVAGSLFGNMTGRDEKYSWSPKIIIRQQQLSSNRCGGSIFVQSGWKSMPFECPIWLTLLVVHVNYIQTYFLLPTRHTSYRPVDHPQMYQLVLWRSNCNWYTKQYGIFKWFCVEGHLQAKLPTYDDNSRTSLSNSLLYGWDISTFEYS